MMMNLFSVFDPSSSIMMLQLNWLSSLIGVSILPLNMWLTPSRVSCLPSIILVTLHKEFKLLAHNKGATLLFTSLFLFIMLNNVMGLVPYIFTSTSHMLTTLSLALPLWLSFMLFGWITSPNHMFIHLIPQGTPGPLMSFMACIETISNMIRPGTLAIRLAANMIAGHLLMTLLGNQGPSIMLSLLPFLIITQILLIILESAVAVIQSYVFVVLSVLYSSEVS
uniref:ATP synthase subunit a n=1 Tax=Mecistocephalus marmoratus TaxID=980230 RepID=A0A4Y1K803_9MYRI|nr:ATP synthase F0 subunit 6 [Mecistocephalus marmoratus]ARU77308.1 ATP synthase F0 subunit 6 [Mecistocephalus marmoratus]